MEQRGGARPSRGDAGMAGCLLGEREEGHQGRHAVGRCSCVGSHHKGAGATSPRLVGSGRRARGRVLLVYCSAMHPLQISQGNAAGSRPC